jgi:hypothetical protein
MKKLYLIGAVVVFLLILILSLPQIGATCIWYPPVGTTALAAFVLLQAAGLGIILGGLLVLYWKFPKEEQEDEDVEIGGNVGTEEKKEEGDAASGSEQAPPPTTEEKQE